VFFEKKSCSSAAATDEFWGQKSLFRHPAGTGKCPQSHIHRRRRLLRVSIDFTAISTNVAVSDDEKGVVLPRG
jgi:hypothetical protein